MKLSGRINSLLSFDKIRFLKFIEIIQYTFIFLVITLIVTNILNKTYYKNTKYYESKKVKKIQLFFELLFELIMIIILFFYIRKLGLLIPSISSIIYPKFRPYTTLEYTIHISIVVIFIELLPHFKKRLEILNDKLL